ncbi:MAG: patatin-like phospholipase family protein [Woeseiaceae bacterium]|nr:patatin-like phospholipase family protein [Woeseiaceae bacterium]
MDKRISTATLVAVAALVAAVLLPPRTTAAATDDRPRVGVVLGGGGARGAAHIGVLRELERLQVPIDAIAGTSMGAIIGGLYAAGYTPDELERIVSNLDWQDAFSDDERRENKRYRRKQDDFDYPIGFELGLKDGQLQLPRGAIAGQKVALILRDLTLHVPADIDFDDLPTPFRAVAADLATGELHRIGEGDLAQAIRASMAAPGVIAPVTVDDRVLVDGGLGGNVPVDALRAMDVDVIIAVDVEFPLYDPDQIRSALDVSYQMLTILIRNQTQRQLATLGDQDVLIRPDLGQFGSTEFGRIGEAIAPGSQAARRRADDLSRYSVGAAEWQYYLQRRQERTPRAPDRVEFVRVRSEYGLAPQVLRARLQTERGDPVDADRFAADASALYGLHVFERVGYRLVAEDGRHGVEFVGHGRSWGPNYVQFGMSLQDDFEGSTSFNLSARLTRTAINALGAEWRNDLQLGTQPAVRSEFYQPLSFDARYFVAPRIELEQSNFNVFSDDLKLARYRISEAEAGLDLGRELGHWGEARLGAFRGYADASLKVGDPTLPSIQANTGGVFAQLAVDTLDDAQIPRNGVRGQLRWVNSFRSLGAEQNADALESSISFVRSFGRHSVELAAIYNTSLEETDLVQNFYPLGGFLRLSGLARGEISGPHAGVARVVYYRRSGETGGGLFEIPLYLGASLEAGNVWQRRSDIAFDGAVTSGSLFLGMDTYLGPLYLAAGFAEGGRSNFYLSLGSPP